VYLYIKYRLTSVLLNDAVSTQEVTENKSQAAVVLADYSGSRLL